MMRFSFVCLLALAAAEVDAQVQGDAQAQGDAHVDADAQVEGLSSSSPGVVGREPAKGISVRVGNRYMVPYVDKIPGTEVEFAMIPIPGGTFLMGSPPNEPTRKEDEGPQIEVRVPPMWVGMHELTQQEYREFELLYEVFIEIENRFGEPDIDGEGVDVVTAPTQLYDPNSTYEWGAGPNYPAVAMTQFAAQQYTKWLSAMTKRQYRLPTEAEWEYACRAGSKDAFAWGDEVADGEKYAWCDPLGEGFHEVGEKRPNRFGLHDMHGNVGEWTVNAYTKDGYRSFAGKGPVDALKMVSWPQTASSCVVRGGCWEFNWWDLRCATRLASDDDAWKEEDAFFPRSPWWFTSDPARSIGFRLFRSYEPLDDALIKKFWDHTSEEIKEYVAEFVNGGRGRIGILDDKLLPAIKEYRVSRAVALEKRRLQREKVRNARPK